MVLDSRDQLFQPLSDDIDSSVVAAELHSFRQATTGLRHIARIDERFGGGEQLLQSLTLALKLTLTGERFERVGSDLASFPYELSARNGVDDRDRVCEMPFGCSLARLADCRINLCTSLQLLDLRSRFVDRRSHGVRWRNDRRQRLCRLVETSFVGEGTSGEDAIVRIASGLLVFSFFQQLDLRLLLELTRLSAIGIEREDFVRGAQRSVILGTVERETSAFEGRIDAILAFARADDLIEHGLDFVSQLCGFDQIGNASPRFFRARQRVLNVTSGKEPPGFVEQRQDRLRIDRDSRLVDELIGRAVVRIDECRPFAVLQRDVVIAAGERLVTQS